MRHPQYTLTPAAVHHHATALVQRHLRLRDHGPKCQASVVLTLLFTAAAWVTSLAETCRRLRGAPSDEAVRLALLATLPTYAELQRCLNAALASRLPPAVHKRRHPLALDLVLIPYHGQPQQQASEVYRSQPKHGTTHFHAYATVYLVRKGRRFTVALTPVAKSEALPAVLQRLLRQAARVGVRPRYLLLDRAFYSVAVIRYLQAAHSPFIMPVVGRGRQASHPRGPSGSRRFWRWTRSGWSTYTLRTVPRRQATVQICVKCRNYRGQWGRHGRRPLVYAYWGMQPPSPQWVSETYRRRFASETTYRQLHQARIRTSTRNPLLRLVYVGLALILRNVWVWLHLRVLAKRQPGGRHIDLALLRFRTLLWWVGQLALTLFGGHEAIETEYAIDRRS
jgi:Transposase DDE domain